ncbi:MAG: family 20 glycosylhydrolase [Victivallales bacterium]|nr:family 20 glycosylhydrolase [Victivallales bacterium]
MYLGKLNVSQSPVAISYAISRIEDGAEPTIEKAGNPLLGESLLVRWDQLYLSGLQFTFRISATVFLDTIVLKLPQGCAAEKISVYDDADGQLLAVHAAETGKSITTQDIELTVATELAAFRLVIDAPFSDIGLENLDLYGACGSDLPIFPTPIAENLGTTTIPVAAFTCIDSDCPEGKQAATILCEKLQETYGIALTENANGKPIRFRRNPSISANGYSATVAEDVITLEASDLRGFVIAAETLLKSIKDNGYPLGRVEDAPRFNFRGVHLFLPPADQFDFARRLIKHLISPMGYNYVILEFAGGMRFDSHPEITEAVLHAKQMAREGKWPALPHGAVGGDGVLEKADVAAYIDYIRSFGIEVIPEVQSLGHVQYITVAHPEIAELENSAEEVIDQRFADSNKGKFFAHCYCPSNEKSYEIIFDLMDEIIEVARPTEYVHIGHDEVYQLGVCPVCKTKNPADLYYNDVMRMHDYLAKKGLKTMLWSDMVQPASSYKSVPALKRLPKDIVMMDFIWYFHLDKDIEPLLTQAGFQVIIGNLYSSHFPRFEKRMKNPGVIGGQISMWKRMEEHILGRGGKFYDIMLTAQMLWSASYTHCLRYAYDRIIRRLTPALRDQIGNRKSPSLIPSHTEMVLFSRSGAPDPERDATGIDITMNGAFDSLRITHACPKQLTRIPWVKLENLGNYEVTYADDTTAVIPVDYAGNICYWNRRQGDPLKPPYYRHNGYIGTYFADTTESRLRDGRIVTLYHYEWLNPQKDKAIKRLRYIPAQNAKTDIVIYGVTGISCQ